MHGLDRRRHPTPSPSGSRVFHMDHHHPGTQDFLELESMTATTTCSQDVNIASSSGITPVCHGMVAIAGRRRQMENAVSAVPAFLTIHLNDVYHFFGVYNGHGGPEAAEFCKKKLYQVVTEEIKSCVLEDCDESTTAELLHTHTLTSSQWTHVMNRSFSKVCSEMNDCLDCFKRPPAGSTAAVVVVNLNQIVIANTGDSRAVLYKNGTVFHLDNATKKQIKECKEVYDDDEYESHANKVVMLAAGNECVTFSEPAVECFERSEEDEFLILASRGLWDVVETGVACETVRMCLNRVNNQASTESSSDFAAAFLVKLAFSRGSSSNISVVVIDFKLNM